MHSFLGHESADVEVVEFGLTYEEWLEAFTTPRSVGALSAMSDGKVLKRWLGLLEGKRSGDRYSHLVWQDLNPFVRKF